MSSKKHMLQAAAGNAGGDRPNAVINGEGLVYDVTDPENIVALSSVTFPSTIYVADGLAYHNNYLYAPGTSGYLGVYNATDPNNITDINATVPAVGTGAYTKVIDPDENVLYCSRYGKGAVHTFDISDPTNVTELNELLLSSLSAAVTYGIGLDAANNRLIATNQYGQLKVLDCSDPSNLSVISSATPSAGSTRSIQCLSSAQRAYYGSSYSDFYTIDYSSDLTLSYSYITHAVIDDIQQVAIDQTNQIAYAADRNTDRIIAFDISGTTASVISSLAGSPTNYLNSVHSVAINDEGTVAYASAAQYFCTIDISDPTNMSFIDTVAQSPSTQYGLTKLW